MFPPTQFDLHQHNALSAGLNWAEWSIYSLFPRGKASAKCCKVHENHGDNRFWSLQKHEYFCEEKSQVFQITVRRNKSCQRALVHFWKYMLDQKKIYPVAVLHRRLLRQLWKKGKWTKWVLGRWIPPSMTVMSIGMSLLFTLRSCCWSLPFVIDAQDSSFRFSVCTFSHIPDMTIILNGDDSEHQTGRIKRKTPFPIICKPHHYNSRMTFKNICPLLSKFHLIEVWTKTCLHVTGKRRRISCFFSSNIWSPLWLEGLHYLTLFFLTKDFASTNDGTKASIEAMSLNICPFLKAWSWILQDRWMHFQFCFFWLLLVYLNSNLEEGIRQEHTVSFNWI